MGDGDKKYISYINKLQKKYPKKLAYSSFIQKKETSIYAGADILLLPSRFEPCGINQLKAMRYGCIPIVHKIIDQWIIFNINPILFKLSLKFSLLIA